MTAKIAITAARILIGPPPIVILPALYPQLGPIVIAPAKTFPFKHWLGLAGMLLCTACAHDLGLMKKEETLNAYRSAIRWSAFEQADSFRSARAPYRGNSEHLQDIRVTGYDIVGEQEDKENLTMHQAVSIRYYRTGDLVEKSTIDHQDWHYDRDLGKWVIDSPLPIFR